jgi:hypothetical protein
MTGVRFADVQGRPAEFLNLTSLTLEEFEVAPFEFQGRRGASMGNPEPLHRLPDLPAVNAGRSAVLPAHLPERNVSMIMRQAVVQFRLGGSVLF